MKNNLLFEAIDISKSFPGVQALNQVNFQLKKGEIHALIGENGAGKSTLVKIISGLYEHNEGSIFIDGKKVEKLSTDQAIEMGISVVYQELSLFEHMSVAENIFISHLPKSKSKVFLAKKELHNKTEELFKLINISISPELPVRMLNTAYKQLVVIAKAFSQNTRILIMDEPTTALTGDEVEVLFKILRKMADMGMGIIYVSHRMDEIFRLAERVTVLRDGKNVGTVDVKSSSTEEVISMMIGKKLNDFYSKRSIEIKDENVIKVTDASISGNFSNVSFNLRKGEMLGLYGLMGSGLQELGNVLAGATHLDKGNISLNNREIKFKSPKHAIEFGIGYVPNDRKAEGIFLNQTNCFNIVIANLKKYSTRGFLDKKKQENAYNFWIKKLNISATSKNQIACFLSGGNQQKIILAKWLDRDTNIYILNEPTRGVDIGAKSEIYKILAKQCDEGKSAIVISPDLPELLGICDRIIIMNRGRVVAEFKRKDFNESIIMKKALTEEQKSTNI
jgi:ribose transport system ATP-binding protein